MPESGRTVVVVGGSAAGLRCAARLRRLRPDWRVRVVEQREVFSYGACGLPYVLSGDIGDLTQLRTTTYDIVRDAEYFESFKGLEILAPRRAVAVDIEGQTLGVEGPDGSETLAWDELVLATGARARRLPNQPDDPRIRGFHELGDVPPLKQGLARGQISRAVIVGAGLVGCELAEAFAGMWGAEVVLVEAGPHPLPLVLGPETGAIAAHQLREEGVELHLGASVTEFIVENDAVGVVAGGRSLRGDVVIVAVGVDPATELAAEAGIELGPSRAILTDGRMSTSADHVWAVGDCVAVRDALTDRPRVLPLGSLANRQGRLLANVLAGGDDHFPPVCGAVAVKLFDWNAAAVGLTRQAAEAAGLDARSTWLAVEDRAHYWPESEVLYLELVHEAGSARVLGLQAIGRGQASRIVDVATQHIAHGARLSDLGQVEHAYAPPYAPALDPLAVAAFVAENHESGVVPCSPLTESVSGGLVDVREEEERGARPLAEADSEVLSIEQLRAGARPRLAEPWILVCERGTRGSEAARVLSSDARPAVYLGGGLSWRRAAGVRSPAIEGVGS